jgi:hypothetical protein
MWRTGSSFDGEEFRLSDPSLYRVLESADESLTDLVGTDPRSTPRRRRSECDRRAPHAHGRGEPSEDPW